jgi:hypothetical protein
MRHSAIVVMTFISYFFASSMINSVAAHELSTAYINASIEDSGQIKGEIKINLIDLEGVLPLDSDQDGELTWGEIVDNSATIENYILQNVHFLQDGNQCPLTVISNLSLQQLSDDMLLLVSFSAACNNNVNSVTVDYEMLFESDAKHKAILSLVEITSGNEFVSVFDASATQQTITISSSNIFGTFITFLYQGIFHILIGIDHILFLLTLLLTIPMEYRNKKWHAIASRKSILHRTLWVISAFTLAHSITLSGTALGWLPSFGSWIEVVIAASILFNVVNNICPLIHRLGLITFAFGLIHGMGFAGALAELGFPEQQQVVSVLAFNVGVELGQIAILLVCLPVLIFARNKLTYQKYVMPSVSILIGLLAIYWVIERF